MEVKGTAVKTIPEYIQRKYSDIYDKWYSSLSEESHQIFDNPILATKWYDLEISMLSPMKILANISKKDLKDLFWDMGVFSSIEALTGIYKVFIRISSTNFIIGRAANILSTYYKNTEIRVLESEKNNVTLEFLKFPKEVNLVMYRIGGWIQNTFYAVGCKNVTAEIKNIEDSYEFKTLIIVKWE
jgi:hypothetical protein